MSDLLGNTSMGDTAHIIIWSLVLIALIVGGFVGVAVVKKWLNQPADSALGAHAGFTLSDLRRLHRDGEISDAEFEKAKTRIIGATKPSEAPKIQTPADGS
jgi:Short C-terminal domain